MEKEKKKNPILFVLFAIILPLLVTISLLYVALILVGVDVKEKVAEVPVLSALIKTNEEKQLQEKIAKQEEIIAAKEEEIQDLTKDVESLRAIADELELDLKKKKKNEEHELTIVNQEDRKEEETNEELKRAASSYRQMDPSSAANIIIQMNDADAVLILTNIPSEVRGNILAEMEAKKAANLTKLMME